MTLPLVVQRQGPDEPIFLLDARNRFIARMDEGTERDARILVAAINHAHALASECKQEED